MTPHVGGGCPSREGLSPPAPGPAGSGGGAVALALGVAAAGGAAEPPEDVLYCDAYCDQCCAAAAAIASRMTASNCGAIPFAIAPAMPCGIGTITLPGGPAGTPGAARFGMAGLPKGASAKAKARRKAEKAEGKRKQLAAIKRLAAGKAAATVAIGGD